MSLPYSVLTAKKCGKHKLICICLCGGVNTINSDYITIPQHHSFYTCMLTFLSLYSWDNLWIGGLDMRCKISLLICFEPYTQFDVWRRSLKFGMFHNMPYICFVLNCVQ